MQRYFVLLFFAILGVAACGNYPGPESGIELPTLGEVSLQLRIPEGFRFSVFNYDIAGPSFHTSGQLKTATSTTISGLITEIPAGTGYVVTLTAIDDDHTVGCRGTSNMSVVAGVTTTVDVPVSCKLASRSQPVPNSPFAVLALGALLVSLGAAFAGNKSARMSCN
jgi:hypothetical protein